MINYTFSITSGAGGFAISPQLTAIRMVEGNRSQAFIQIINLPYSIHVKRKERAVHVGEDVIASLRGLLCAGDASPFDVDEDGRTLLHVSHI